MFQLACDPSGKVVDTTIKDLVPALINWGNKMDHMLQVLLSHILASAQVLHIFIILVLTDVSLINLSSGILCFPALSTSFRG